MLLFAKNTFRDFPQSYFFSKTAFGIFRKATFSQKQLSGFSAKPLFLKSTFRDFPQSSLFQKEAFGIFRKLFFSQNSPRLY